MFNIFAMRKRLKQLQAALEQLPRLIALRFFYENRLAPSCNFLTRVHDDHLALIRRRESSRRAAVHWFLKGSPDYEDHTAPESALLAHLHTYIQSGGLSYLKRAEEHWDGTLEIEHFGGVESKYWIQSAPTNVRLIEDKKSA